MTTGRRASAEPTGPVDPVEPVDPHAVAAAVSGVPGVRLHPGAVAATHLPGRRVGGVRLTERGTGRGAELGVEVHVSVTYPLSVGDAAQAVRRALAPLGLARVDVVVEDVVGPQGLSDPGSVAAPDQDETGGSHG